MERFTIASEAIDPVLVTIKKHNDATAMSGIGLGTFGSDHVSAKQMANGVRHAVSLGYRFLDCAACYANEDMVG